MCANWRRRIGSRRRRNLVEPPSIALGCRSLKLGLVCTIFTTGGCGVRNRRCFNRAFKPGHSFGRVWCRNASSPILRVPPLANRDIPKRPRRRLQRRPCCLGLVSGRGRLSHLLLGLACGNTPRCRALILLLLLVLVLTGGLVEALLDLLPQTLGRALQRLEGFEAAAEQPPPPCRQGSLCNLRHLGDRRQGLSTLAVGRLVRGQEARLGLQMVLQANGPVQHMRLVAVLVQEPVHICHLAWIVLAVNRHHLLPVDVERSRAARGCILSGGHETRR
mmetsp:Transcript_77463/g.250637  ORF Transcript_77463/g.250637 Transcript_77463/m.250637 type:complete len:276 (-) Transcript_77463:350-1177(-)